MGKSYPKKPELIAPAGDMERLKTAIHFGADAVYLSGKSFSLRNISKNFTIPELSEAVCYAHGHHRRVYLAINSFLKNQDLAPFREFLEAVSPLGFDGLILSDPAALEICRKQMPAIPLHLSTQTNTLNALAARYWFSQGIRRIVLARELSLEEIKEIKKETKGEIEIFVHGAMCMAYSGRCLLSLYLNQRDANQGLCTQTCRWKYALVEEKRPGFYFPIQENDQGTYILNSKDLCLITSLPEIIQGGVDALKIEGRRKGIHYLAAIIRTYRWAIDQYVNDPDNYQLSSACLEELFKVSHRDYTTGFIYGADEKSICVETDRPTLKYTLAAIIRDHEKKEGWVLAEARGPIRIGDSMELIGQSFPNPVFTITAMKTLEGEKCFEAHGGTKTPIWIYLPVDAEPGDLLRKRME